MGDLLRGCRVLVTRPRDRTDALVAALEAEGADVVVEPMIEVVAAADPRPLARAARTLERWDWVAFTSAYGVRALADAAGAGTAAAVGGPGRPRVACVGQATAEAAQGAGWSASVVGGGDAESLAAGMLAAIPEGRRGAIRVLFPRAEDARPTLAAALRGAGIVVDEVVAYRKVRPGGDRDLSALLAAGGLDVLTFTSPSTARNFVRSFGTAVGGARTVAIGRTTAGAVRQQGLPGPVVASEASVTGLVRAVITAFHESDGSDHGQHD